MDLSPTKVGKGEEVAQFSKKGVAAKSAEKKNERKG